MSIDVWGALARSFCLQLTHLFSTPTAGSVDPRVFACSYPHPCKSVPVPVPQNFLPEGYSLGVKKELTTTIKVVKLKVMKEKVGEAEPKATTKKKSMYLCSF
jgi:hypothetical protein